MRTEAGAWGITSLVGIREALFIGTV